MAVPCLIAAVTASNDKGKILQRSLANVFYELDQVTASLSSDEIDEREIKLLVCSGRYRLIQRIIEFNKAYPFIKFKTDFEFETE